jgi:hypothetical protein
MCRWEDNIKMNLKEIACDAGDCIQFVQYVPMAVCCEHGSIKA